MKKVSVSKININWIVYIPIICFVVNLLVILLVLLLRNNIPPQVPLFFGKAQGEEQLATQGALILPALLAIIVTVLNIILSTLFKDTFLQKVLIGVIVIATLLSTITIFRIVLLVGSF